MTEECRRRRLFSSPMKVLVTVLLYLGIAMSSVSGMLFLQLMEVSGGDPITVSDGSPYYATSGCGWKITSDLMDLSRTLEARKKYDADGQYDPEQIIDITRDYSDGTASVQPDIHTSYSVEELYQMLVSGLSEELGSLAAESDYAADAVASEDAQRETAQRALAYMDRETWEHLRTVGRAEEYSDQFLYLYGRGYPLEKAGGFQTAGGGTLADYAAANPEDVSLRDLYSALSSMAGNIYEYVWNRENPEQMLDGATNLRYYVTDDFRTYTNSDQWKEITEEEIAAQTEAMPMHILYRRSGGQIADRDFPDTAAGYQLSNTLAARQILSPDERVYVVLDTSWPVEDSYRTEAQFFQRFSPWSGLLLALAVSGLLLAAVSFILSTVQAGRNEHDREVRLYGFDQLPTEAAAALGVVLGFLFIGGIGAISLNSLSAFSPLWMVVFTVHICLSVGLFMLFYLSLVRRIKGHNLWERSLIRAVISLGEKVYEARRESSRLILTGVGLMLLHFIALPFLGVFGFLLCLTADILVLLYMLREATGKQNVIEGMRQLGSGNLDYRVDAGALNGNNRELAEVVNAMGSGLQAAVEERMRNERMQADLITNVSHDIKTPLTSIINYVDLLKRENMENPRIKGYIDILDRKSQRLKQLAEDLVEASKASSGNVKMEFTVLNLNELIQQVNGEFDERLAARDLELICSLPAEPSLVRADSRYLWRVVENLYGNVAKYAMPHSRVYAEVGKEEGQVLFTIKNMSEQTLNVSPDELMERFVRGDRSRTTEGSGLGLSIAQSLTGLMDGSLKITVDGDLFKVCVCFPEVIRKEEEPPE